MRHDGCILPVQNRANRKTYEHRRQQLDNLRIFPDEFPLHFRHGPLRGLTIELNQDVVDFVTVINEFGGYGHGFLSE